jgi:hypothetical protein
MNEITNLASKGIVIAPEVFGVIDFPHVRWCLNKPGLLGGPSSYPAGTKVFHFHPDLEESAKAASHGSSSLLFTIGTVDLPALEPITKEYVCWYRGKYKQAVDLKSHKNELEITASWPQEKIQYWELLNKTKILRSYDNFTSVIADGILMGCEVLCWNGQTFDPISPSEDLHQYVIDKDRDLEAVRRFTESVATS